MNIQEYIFNINKKTKILGGFVILIAVSYFLYNFLITPLFVQQKMLRLDLRSQRRLSEAKISSVTRIAAMQEELTEAKEGLQNIEKKFLTEQKFPSFVEELRSLAERNNVKILNLTVSEAKQLTLDLQNRYGAIPINVSLSGNYMDVLTFFAQLREKEVFFSVPQLFMNASDKEGRLVRTDLQLTAYLVYQ